MLDLGLPDSVGLQTVRKLYAQVASAPAVIVLSIVADEELAVQAVQLGAQDYLIKGLVDSSTMVRSLRYGVERRRAEEALLVARADLEDRVRERTAELGRVVETLNADITERKRRKSSSCSRRSWRASGGWPAGWPTTSTTSSPPSSATAERHPRAAADNPLVERRREDQAGRGARRPPDTAAADLRRRAVVELRMLDLSELTVNLSHLLRRLIGEDVELVVAGAAPKLWLVAGGSAGRWSKCW